MPLLVDWIQRNCEGTRIHASPYSPVQRTFYQGAVVAPGASDLAPRMVVDVRDPAELAAILRAAYRLGEPVHVRQGTGQVQLDLVHPFPPGAVVLDLRHFRGIDVRPANGWIEVGAAVTHGETNELLRPIGYGFPFGWEPITWGGLASINLSGHAVGPVSDKPGDYVLGLQVILPGGDTIETGTRAIRKPVGPDLTRLFVGSQSLLGVITRLRLRLVALAPGKAWGCASFRAPSDLVATACGTWTGRLAPPVLYEMMDRRFVADTALAPLVPPGELLLVQVDGYRQEEADWKLARILELARECGAQEARVLSAERAWDTLWEIRRAPVKALAAQGDYFVAEVLDAPLDRLDDAMTRILAFRDEMEARFDGLRGYVWGHIGSGTIHPAFLSPRDWHYDRRVEVARVIRGGLLGVKVACAASVGEHGIFPMHADWYEDAFGRRSIDIQRALKRALDPRGVLNPTRMTPTEA